MEVMEAITPLLGGLASFATMIFYLVLTVVILAPLLFLLWYKLTYKIKVTVKEPIGDNTFIDHQTVARYKTVDGVTFVELYKKFNGNIIQLKEIPGDALCIDSRGKKCVTIVLFNDNAAFLKVKPTDVPETYSADFFSTDMQLMLAEQMKKSKKYDELTVLKAINNHAGLIALTIMFICVLAFWETITAPIITAQNAQATIAKQNADTTAKLNMMYQSVCMNQQTISTGGVS